MKELLLEHLQTLADPQVKSWWENYIQQHAPFRGVKMAQIRLELHQWYADNIQGNIDDSEQIELALSLIREKYSEDKLAGILFLQEILIPAGAIHSTKHLIRFEELFSDGFIYDWNICDWFCIKVLSPLIKQDGFSCAQAISKWSAAETVWQARASLVPFTLLAADRAYYPLIQDSCTTLIQRPERFSKTAVGWILRDISRHNTNFVDQILDSQLGSFSMESLNNAIKYYESGYKKEIKQRYKTLRSKGQK